MIRAGVQARFSSRNEHKMGMGRNKRQETHSVRKELFLQKGKSYLVDSDVRSCASAVGSCEYENCAGALDMCFV